jgi:hypothetical protein
MHRVCQACRCADGRSAWEERQRHAVDEQRMRELEREKKREKKEKEKQEQKKTATNCEYEIPREVAQQ